MATHSSIFAWRIPWTEEPGGLQSLGSQRVGHAESLMHTHILSLRLPSIKSSSDTERAATHVDQPPMVVTVEQTNRMQEESEAGFLGLFHPGLPES